jgi:hypothetical protein
MSPGRTVLDRVETVILGRYNCSKYLFSESRYFTLSFVSLNASVMLLKERKEIEKKLFKNVHRCLSIVQSCTNKLTKCAADFLWWKST